MFDCNKLSHVTYYPMMAVLCVRDTFSGGAAIIECLQFACAQLNLHAALFGPLFPITLSIATLLGITSALLTWAFDGKYIAEYFGLKDDTSSHPPSKHPWLQRFCHILAGLYYISVSGMAAIAVLTMLSISLGSPISLIIVLGWTSIEFCRYYYEERPSLNELISGADNNEKACNHDAPPALIGFFIVACLREALNALSTVIDFTHFLIQQLKLNRTTCRWLDPAAILFSLVMSIVGALVFYCFDCNVIANTLQYQLPGNSKTKASPKNNEQPLSFTGKVALLLCYCYYGSSSVLNALAVLNMAMLGGIVFSPVATLLITLFWVSTDLYRFNGVEQPEVTKSIKTYLQNNSQ